MEPAGLASPIFPGRSGQAWPSHRSWDISIWTRNGWHWGLCEFHSCALFHLVSQRELFRDAKERVYDGGIAIGVNMGWQSIFCRFVFREAVSHNKYCCSLKSKNIWRLAKFCASYPAGHCLPDPSQEWQRGRRYFLLTDHRQFCGLSRSTLKKFIAAIRHTEIS